MWNNFIKITDFSPAFMSDMFMTRKFNRKRFSLSIFILLGKNFFFKAFWIKAFHLIFTVFALNSPQRPKSEARSTVDGVHMWEPRWANVSREEKWSCSHIRLAQLFSNIYCLWQDNVPKCHFKEEKTENLHTYHSQKKNLIYIHITVTGCTFCEQTSGLQWDSTTLKTAVNFAHCYLASDMSE